jgi:predicted dithiol-disulfide oxidoreductase (DUF899 family)
LAQRRQELPWVRVDKEYRFETDEGSASLADLFRGRSQFLVYHFIFGPAGTDRGRHFIGDYMSAGTVKLDFWARFHFHLFFCSI